MKIFFEISSYINNFLCNHFSINSNNIKNISYDFNIDEKRLEFGDFSINAPLVLTKICKKNPKDIANEIIKNFKNENIEKIELAGVGFLNFYCKDIFYKNILLEIQKNNFNDNLFISKNKNSEINYNVEFVSANPTGPLHIGHGRGGIIGDTISRILKEKEYNCSSEFYINDAGIQIEKLGLSLLIRYKQVCGETIDLPENVYMGEYLIDMAQDIYNQYNSSVLEKEISWFSEYAKNILLFNLQSTLSNYGINFDVWFSEKTLHLNKSIDNAVNELIQKEYIYETVDKTLWFKSTLFGDEKDRVIKKANSDWTYVAADIAYIKNKIDRGFNKIIMILGQDHHSFAIRLKGILQALGHDSSILNIILYQLVTVKDANEIVRLSKRKGNIIELKDIIDTVGKDITRFFYLNKKADAHLDFDIHLALQNINNNPVYYIQYAYVRMNSIVNKYNEIENDCKILENSEYLFTNFERILIRKIFHFDIILENIINLMQPHLLSYYILEISGLFHSYYSSNKFILENNELEMQKRIFILKMIFKVIQKGLNLLGMEELQKM